MTNHIASITYLRQLLEGPAGSPIAIIGSTSNSELWSVSDELDKRGWSSLLRTLLGGDTDIYDMTTRPDKGDAFHGLKKDTPLIVAFHLYGLDPMNDRYRDTSPGYMYNPGNYRIYEFAKKHQIPMLVWGEQPEGSSTGWKSYFADGIKKEPPLSIEEIEALKRG